MIGIAVGWYITRGTPQGVAFDPPESSPHDGVAGGEYCTRACGIAACIGDREWELAGAAVALRLARSARGFGDASRGAFARSYLAKCVLAAGADRGVLAALRDDVAGGDGPAVAWILKASQTGGARV